MMLFYSAAGANFFGFQCPKDSFSFKKSIENNPNAQKFRACGAKILNP